VWLWPSEDKLLGLDPKDLTRQQVYKIMSGTVVPRPIAWITTACERGRVNAAPFSAYTIISQDPPLVLFQADAANGEKDTIANIRATGEFVVNTTTSATLDKMHNSSAPLPRVVSEPEVFGIELTPSKMISVPRVLDSPVAFECRLHHMFDVGNEPHTVVIGEIVYFQIEDGIFRDGKIDQEKLDPIARIGGPYYARLGDLLHYPSASAENVPVKSPPPVRRVRQT
jgi:flavin reductase (DIM6/NTAB) family NADH-FMN oxidoreductase RutF